jgi:DNA-directed RNA polymerase specialized sigma24 family protein
MPSEDDMQDAMEHICLAARTFDESRGVRFASYAKKYLMKSMTYKKTPSFRKSGTPVHADMFTVGLRYEHDPDLFYGNGSPETKLILKDLILKAISTFPEKVKIALVSHHLTGEDYNDIAMGFGYRNPRSLSKHVRDWCKRVQGGAID